MKELIHEMSKIGNISMEQLLLNKGDKFRFPIYMNDAFMNTEIDALDLSVRASNGLKRAGFVTIGSMINQINGREDLLKLRNMGRKSVSEVMEKLFCYQFSLMNDERKKKFVARVIELNS